MKAVIIGSGNVADALARAVKTSDVNLVQIIARNETAGKEIAQATGTPFTTDIDNVAQADIYLITVNDSNVKEVSEHLCVDSNAVVAHVAGALTLDDISKKIEHRAVVYPLQTFTKGREFDIRKIPVFIEYSTPHAGKVVEEFANALSDRVMYSSSELRTSLHIAAVFACNFTNHLFALAADILHERGLSFDLMKPMITEMVDKAFSTNYPATMQTGPAHRGDMATIERHMKSIRDDEQKKGYDMYTDIYKYLSESIWITSKQLSEESKQ